MSKTHEVAVDLREQHVFVTEFCIILRNGVMFHFTLALPSPKLIIWNFQRFQNIQSFI